jgi:hypothetical protein
LCLFMIGSFGIMLDLVETIGRLLVHSERNQTEFRNIDGYTFFINLVAASSDDEFATPGIKNIVIFMRFYSTQHIIEGKIFLDDCFGMFFALALDANSNKRVGNRDALQLLFRIAKNSQVIAVQLQALSTIQDILEATRFLVILIDEV